ncbi:DNA polymerase I [Rhizobiales bacterium Sp-1]|uniref:DNA polymerase I n=2 Tax=Segnochrobactrum spirostomi TaxID=2608987 RepID=A0A6A7Y3W5_9HYPH|nr:DNA polymerase I [Segnochrobactrum spirostomi]MQT12801.1 DNA polymerase I [Segnochrobactrum spirostomi]
MPNDSAPSLASAPPVRPGDHVFLVDGSSFVFRAYFQSMNQDRKYNYRSDGLPTGAVRLFCTKLLQFVRDGAVGIRPTHLAIIFDKSENSFRKAIYPPYKAHRPDPPADLVPQFPLMRAAVRAFGLIPIEQDTYEADDLIATYAREANAAGADVLIISADKDLMQLIRPGVAMYDPASGEAKRGSFRPERRIGYDEVVDYFGVPPEKVVDVQSLAGDATDNVPGVPGIGIKTAAQLIGEYGDLDTLLARAAEIKQPKRRESLLANAEQARISRRLVALVDDVKVEVPLADLTLVEPEPKPLVAFLKAMEFTTLTRRIAELGGVDVSAIEPDPFYAVGNFGPGTADAGLGDDVAPEGGAEAAPVAVGEAEPPREAPGEGPGSLAIARRQALGGAAVDHAAYETITSTEQLERWIAAAFEAGVVAVDTETNSLDPMQADLVGVSLATAPGRAAYLPLLHKAGDDGLFGGGLVPDQVPVREALDRLKPLLEDPSVLKVGQNLKFDWLLLSRYGIEIAPYDDTMLISYALDAGDRSHGMDDLSERHLGHKPIAFKDVAGSGKAQITFDRVPVDRATHYAAEDADITLRLWLVLKPRLAAEGMTSVYERLERPMIPVLARMERRGIAIDRQILSRLSGEFAQTMARVEAEIADLAGEPFNVASPKQLGEILFERMAIPGGKKTKTGAWGTGADVLEDLAAQGHVLPAKVLEWRQVAKLKSTYTDALPSYLHPETKRVHTSFSLASTTTGRLSSSEPNIQNIPVRTEEGRKIRSAFVAEPGTRLVSADYSQIELRVLAHVADIPQLKKAFADGIDIHAMTASEMFGVPVEGMDPAVRRRAKAINFGIIYGISAFGLAAQLGIGRDEAGAYIRRYFERFPGIRAYMDGTKAFARQHGYVETIFGRRAHYPEIGSSNPSMRAFMERAAINAPIQGSAADIIRRAMVRMEGALAKAKLDAQMLLQVHDELVFQVPEAQVADTIPVIVEVMESAPFPVVELSVPLKVDARAALNWDEAH